MGNVTVAIIKRDVKGAERSVTADITFSNSYATNGDTIVAADIAKLLPEAAGGLTDVTEWFDENDTAGNFAVLDRPNKKFKAFTVAGVEKGNATDQSALKIRFRFAYGQVTG